MLSGIDRSQCDVRYIYTQVIRIANNLVQTTGQFKNVENVIMTTWRWCHSRAQEEQFSIQKLLFLLKWADSETSTYKYCLYIDCRYFGPWCNCQLCKIKFWKLRAASNTSNIYLFDEIFSNQKPCHIWPQSICRSSLTYLLVFANTKFKFTFLKIISLTLKGFQMLMRRGSFQGYWKQMFNTIRAVSSSRLLDLLSTKIVQKKNSPDWTWKNL